MSNVSAVGYSGFIPSGFAEQVTQSAAATVVVSQNYAAEQVLLLDPTANAITVSLPAATRAGLYVVVKDRTGQAGTHNITITPAAGTIDAGATLVISTAYGVVQLVSTGAASGVTWSVVSAS